LETEANSEVDKIMMELTEGMLLPAERAPDGILNPTPQGHYIT